MLGTVPVRAQRARRTVTALGDTIPGWALMHSHSAHEQQSCRTQEKLLGHRSPHAPSCQPQSRVLPQLDGFTPAAPGSARCPGGLSWLLRWGWLLGGVMHGIYTLAGCPSPAALPRAAGRAPGLPSPHLRLLRHPWASLGVTSFFWA